MPARTLRSWTLSSKTCLYTMQVALLLFNAGLLFFLPLAEVVQWHLQRRASGNDKHPNNKHPTSDASIAAAQAALPARRWLHMRWGWSVSSIAAVALVRAVAGVGRGGVATM